MIHKFHHETMMDNGQKKITTSANRTKVPKSVQEGFSFFLAITILGFPNLLDSGDVF